MTQSSSSVGGSRLSYLDNLRIFLTILVIFHHASIAFGGGGSWPVEDPKADLLTSSRADLFHRSQPDPISCRRSSCWPAISPRARWRRRARPYLLDRLIRLGIPLLVYTTLIINLNASISCRCSGWGSR